MSGSVSLVRVIIPRSGCRRSLTSVQPATEQSAEDPKTVERCQLLAFLARTGAVRDRHLVDPLTAQQHAGGNLRLDGEAFLAKRQRAEQLGAHRLVARHDV